MGLLANVRTGHRIVSSRGPPRLSALVEKGRVSGSRRRSAGVGLRPPASFLSTVQIGITPRRRAVGPRFPGANAWRTADGGCWADYGMPQGGRRHRRCVGVVVVTLITYASLIVGGASCRSRSPLRDPEAGSR